MSEALLIIDYQNDFAAPDGALSVKGGEQIGQRINQLAKAGGYELVVATRDWHPADHASFQEQGGIWPVHCVQGTEGAELHPSLERDEVDVVFDKGTDQATDGSFPNPGCAPRAPAFDGRTPRSWSASMTHSSHS